MATINTLATAESIYTDVYGDIDDKRFRDSKMTEIHDWLEAGDLTGSPSVEDLVSEWREYDTEDIAARGV